MPTNRRRRARAHRTQLPRGWRFHLECGRDFFHDGFGDDMEAMRAAWREHGAAMMAERSDDDRMRREFPWAYDEFGPPPGWKETEHGS